MKKFLVLSAVLPVMAVASPTFTPTKQSCQAVIKDAVIMMNYVAPCDESLENPAIFQENATAKSIIDERLSMCDKVFSSGEKEATMDGLVKTLEPTASVWQRQLSTNKTAFCQAQKLSIVQRLNSYL